MTATATATYADPLPILVGDRTLPDGCDTWAIRSVHPDLRSSNGYRYPWPGQWAEAPGPFVDHAGACPAAAGDGICAASSYRGMASGGIPARTLLLVAYASTDVLGRDDSVGKVRLRRMFVVDVLDGDLAAGANLGGANLRGADLRGADLRRADLRGADLRGADLRRANLGGADLEGADLEGANLRGTDLEGTDLRRARADAATTWPTGYDHATAGVLS